MFDFINISFIDILDVLMVGLLVFWMIRLIRGTSAVGIFSGILLLYVIWIVARALKMKLLSFILGQVLGVGVIALIVIFQPEIRRFLLRLSVKYSEASGGLLKKIFRARGKRSEGMGPASVEELTGACRKMSETKTGALIVIKHRFELETYVKAGDILMARINKRLIENIFFKNSPLHDGAMVLENNTIIAARCTLPITERNDVPPRYGMRHRAAIGISDVTDASVIVVSEETGEISFVQSGVLRTMKDISELRAAIENSYKQ